MDRVRGSQTYMLFRSDDRATVVSYVHLELAGKVVTSANMAKKTASANWDDVTQCVFLAAFGTSDGLVWCLVMDSIHVDVEMLKLMLLTA